MYEFNVRRMKAERVARGITVRDMADKMSMTPGTYSKKENGHIRITVDELAKLIDILGLSESECGIFFTHKVAKLTN
ncbi:helix-turn-helix transcriptional regulator [uncultured Staphylococcus sp.]|uniref:helix-turn-helix domain-containing protein n=1 Tax=uncultured Staphylococcus sp. TaxID=189668 RepID=UPI0025F832C3|nr:helix-turn-helix transcriptional regulator [uncultured Staphylococcus sp.]